MVNVNSQVSTSMEIPFADGEYTVSFIISRFRCVMVELTPAVDFV
jgi:hypothetical protein